MLIQTSKLQANQPSEFDDQIYNGLDALVTYEVFEELSSLIDEPTKVTYDFERALQAPVLDIMLRGFKVDEYERSRAHASVQRDLSYAQDALDRMASAVWGEGLNPRSFAQLKAFFHGAMKLPEVWHSKKGVRTQSLDREALEKLDNYFYARPIIAAILSCRDLSKLSSVLESEVDSDGRWRTSYNIGGTETGRLSSSRSAWGTGSNTQNLRRDDDALDGLPSIRRIFIADKGYKLCNIDLEQTESYDVAYEHGTKLGDWTYLDALERGDIHTQVARIVWPELGWTGELRHDRPIADQPFYRNYSYRDMAKRGGHLTNYMGTAFTASRSLKVPLPLMEHFQRAYATGEGALFPAFPRWWRWVAQELETKQELTTPFGRRRHFFGRPREDATLREAIAYVPQSSTADRMNLGMWRIWKHLPYVQLLAQVHDSVCFQFPEELDEHEAVFDALNYTKVRQVDPVSRRLMCVRAEAKVGWNWGSYNEATNPEGMKKWSPKERDQRTRANGRVL